MKEQASATQDAREHSRWSWLTEYGEDAPIAILTCVAIITHLLLRYVWHIGRLDVLPLYVALVAGGIPLLAGLVRQLFKLQFGSDWLAGFSIVTGVLLHEYLVASIVVLMLSGGSALEQYATSRASSALRALARRMPTVAHRVTETGFTLINAGEIVPGDILAIFPARDLPRRWTGGARPRGDGRILPDRRTV